MKNKAGATPLNRLESARVSLFMGGILYYTFIISTVDIFVPYHIVRQAGRDGWISVLITMAEMLPGAAVAIALTLRFPRQTIIEYLQLILGLWPGRLLGLAYIFFLLVLGSTTLREFEEIMTIAFLQLTPKIVFGAVALVLSSYVVFSGIEAIYRVNGAVIPIGVLFLFFVGLSTLPRADFTNYLPVLEQGIGPPIHGSFLLFANLMEGFIILSLLPFVNNPRGVVKAALISIPALGISLLLGTIAIAVFGAELSKKILMPALEMSRLIEIPGIPRLDMLIMLGWFAGIFIKISVIHYLLVLLSAQLAGLGTYKPLIIPFGILLISLSIYMFPNVIELVDFIGSSYTYFLVAFEFAIPLILLFIAWSRRLKAGDQTNPGT
ncbi:MAG: GerAB/ArcD/ProY family transporter [Bacillota bacterium]